MNVDFLGLIVLFMVGSGVPTLGHHGFVKKALWEVYLFVYPSIAGKGNKEEIYM